MKEQESKKKEETMKGGLEMNIRQSSLRVVGIIVLFAVLFARPQMPFSQEDNCHPPSCYLSSYGHKVPFWLATHNNEVFDGQVLQLIKKYGAIFLFNGMFQSEFSPLYDAADIIGRFHASGPDFPVLVYTWPARWYDYQIKIGAVPTLEGYPELGELLLHHPETGGTLQHRTKQGSVLFGDVRTEGYREWFKERVKGTVSITSSNGVVLDNAQRTPTTLWKYFNEDVDFFSDYSSGFDQLVSSLHDELRNENKLLYYNGLWTLKTDISLPEPEYEGRLRDQEKLLEYADGVSIEHFGWHYRSESNPLYEEPSFENDILPYFDIINEHPNKHFLIYGRGFWDYTHYERDYLWQRYLYASYLLTAEFNTHFKYHSSFAIPAHAGRSGGLDIYEDMFLDFGYPEGGYYTKGELYMRDFERGFVVVAPHVGTTIYYYTFELESPMFTPEGERLSGTITLESGTGLLLFEEPPKRIEPFKETFDGWESYEKFDWRWASIEYEGGGNSFLHLDPTPAEQQWEHDLLLGGIRSLDSKDRSILKMRYRTEDPDAKFHVVVEVDELSEKNKPYAVIPVGVDNNEIKLDTGVPFRLPGVGRFRKMTYVPMATRLNPDGKWHEILIDANAALERTVTEGYQLQYEFQRFSHVRFVGEIDVDDILVAGALDLSVEHAYVFFRTEGDSDVMLATDFSATFPSPDDHVAIYLDGTELLDEPFASFSQSMLIPDAYQYFTLNTFVTIYFDSMRIELSSCGLNLAGLDNSNGVDVELNIGTNTAEENIAMIPEYEFMLTYIRSN